MQELQKSLSGAIETDIHHKEDWEVIQTENKYMRVQKVAKLIRKGYLSESEYQKKKEEGSRDWVNEVKRLTRNVSRKRNNERLV